MEFYLETRLPSSNVWILTLIYFNLVVCVCVYVACGNSCQRLLCSKICGVNKYLLPQNVFLYFTTLERPGFRILDHWKPPECFPMVQGTSCSPPPQVCHTVEAHHLKPWYAGIFY